MISARASGCRRAASAWPPRSARHDRQRARTRLAVLLCTWSAIKIIRLAGIVALPDRSGGATVKNTVLCLGVALLLSGCSSVQGTLQEMSLAPASGAGQTAPRTPQMMTAAARATLAAGYTHFKFSEAPSAAAPSAPLGGTRPDAGCVFGATTPVCSEGGHPVSQVGLTLTMFRANEPGAADAFDAKQVLNQYNARQ
jgi:hypothetical protein